MGLSYNMENLHAPTVPSGPTSGIGPDGLKTAGLSLAELQVRKDNMEAELKALGSVLDSHNVNMTTPLTTPDGFPRADIDVAQIRTTRSRIIYLKNDYKALMNVIEKAIHEHFANNIPLPEPIATTSTSSSSSAARQPPPSPAFAKVNTVVPDSPAETAGLKPGDEIRNFGYVNKENNDGLKRVAVCVQGNEGHDVMVKISRVVGPGQRDELQLNLVPRKDWGGRGLLGCHILPI